MLTLPNAIEVTPSRPGAEDFGEKAEATPLSPVEVGYLLDPPVPVTTESGTTYMQEGKLYAPRGSGLRHGDVIPLPEGRFTIVGPAQLDYQHPMTGHDFGRVRFLIRLGG